MKYFFPEYLDISNTNISQEERKIKENQWKIACEKYSEYIINNANIFPKSFLKIYKNGGFHDYKIYSINFNFEDDKKYKKRLDIVVNLESSKKTFSLICKDVKSFYSSFEYEKNSICPYYYLYGEYYKDENRLWHHNFLFGDLYEINITSKDFIFRIGDVSGPKSKK